MRLHRAELRIAIRHNVLANRNVFLVSLLFMATVLSACQPSPTYLSSREERRNERILEKATSKLHRGETKESPWEYINKMKDDRPGICVTMDDAIVCHTRTTYTQRMWGPNPVDLFYNLVVYPEESICSSWVIIEPERRKISFTFARIRYHEPGKKPITRTSDGYAPTVEATTSPDGFLRACNRLFRR